MMFSRIASSAATLRSHGARLAMQSPRAAAAYSITAPRLTQDAVPTNDPTPRKPTPNVSETNAVPTSLEGVTIAEAPDAGEQARQLQAPNRATTWAPSQQPRELGMSGPRFEQTIMEAQPRPYAAIELIHKQPVRWTKQRVVSCDGGGGPLGHPRIFINTDKPEIATCNYCGLPFAHEQHREFLKSLPSTPYPLEPTGDSAEVNETQRVTEGGYEQR